MPCSFPAHSSTQSKQKMGIVDFRSYLGGHIRGKSCLRAKGQKVSIKKKRWNRVGLGLGLGLGLLLGLFRSAVTTRIGLASNEKSLPTKRPRDLCSFDNIRFNIAAKLQIEIHQMSNLWWIISQKDVRITHVPFVQLEAMLIKKS